VPSEQSLAGELLMERLVDGREVRLWAEANLGCCVPMDPVCTVRLLRPWVLGPARERTRREGALDLPERSSPGSSNSKS